MVDLGRLGFILASLFTRIHLSTTYESGSLCMYHAMTFYESFALEVAYKIMKRRLASRVYVFTNLTQVWNSDKTVEYRDQIFMLIIGRTTQKDQLFEKLEEVNFQTAFELIGEEIIDGNLPYLNWASSYIPPYDVANETTLSDTKEAFTFREDFIDKKYGTFPTNHTTFSELDLKSSINSSLQVTQSLNVNPRQDSTDCTRKSEQSPGLKTEKDDTMSEKQEINVKEEPRPIGEQKSRGNRRNLRMRERRYDERNPPRFHSRVREQQYDERNPSEMYGRDRPRYYEQNIPEPEWYERDAQRNYEPNDPDWYENNLPKYFERRNVREPYERDVPEEDQPNAQDWSYEKRAEQATNAIRNSYKGGRRSAGQPSRMKTSRSRSIMDIIKSFINPYSSNKVTSANKAKFARGNEKMRRKTRARKGNQAYQAYEVIYDTDEVETDCRNSEQIPINRYAFAQRFGNRNFMRGQEPRNERRTMRSRRSRARKYERQAPKARQTMRMKAGRMNGMGNPYNQYKMNYAQEMNRRENMKYNYADTYQQEQVRNNRKPINTRDDEGINNYRAPGAIHPEAENNFDHFHHINEAVDHFNRLSQIHDMAKKQNPPHHHNVIHDHQSDPINHANNHKYRNMENNHHRMHETEHIIRPQCEQHDIGHFHSHTNEAFQHDSRLRAGHVGHQNIHPDQPYRAQPANNPHYLPVLHENVNKQPYYLIHNPEGMHVQDDPTFGLGNSPKNQQFRKVKSAPKARKSKAGARRKSVNENQRPFWARKSKTTSYYHQYNAPNFGGYTTAHVIDVVQYHYEPRQNLMF